jgi:hypothetical protein
MFEITVSTEFEAWYHALDAASAEQVAGELNVLERLGPELDAVRASRLLLWFDGTSSAHAPGLREKTEQLGLLMRRRTEALRCLETPNFQARFLKLEHRRAQQGHELIERLRARVRAAGLQLMLANHGKPVRDPARAWLGDSVQSALHDLLEFVGLRVEDVADTESGLRELTLRDLTPLHRLLYAIDMPRRCILVILAEPLERAYYGDAVQLAERRWREYCRNLPLSLHP